MKLAWICFKVTKMIPYMQSAIVLIYRQLLVITLVLWWLKTILGQNFCILAQRRQIKKRKTGEREKVAKFWKYLKYLGPVIALWERCVKTDNCYSICHQSVITRCNKRYLSWWRVLQNATSIITCDDRKTTTGNASVFVGNVFPDAIINDR